VVHFAAWHPGAALRDSCRESHGREKRGDCHGAEGATTKAPSSEDPTGENYAPRKGENEGQGQDGGGPTSEYWDIPIDEARQAVRNRYRQT